MSEAHGNAIDRQLSRNGLNAEIVGSSRKCWVWINSTIPHGPFQGLRNARRWFFDYAKRTTAQPKPESPTCA